MTKQWHTLAIWSVFVASLSGFLQSYATCVIAGALLFIVKEFSLTPTSEGLAASIIILGAILGSLSTGYFADKNGRRAVLLFAAVLYVASNIPILFISSFPLLLFLRFTTGIAVGMTSLACPLYLAEIAPPAKRGAYVCCFQLAVTVGTLIAFALNLGFTVSENWRFMLFFTAIPAAFQAALLFTIPESPKWLLGSGQTKKAAAALKSLHTGDDPPRKNDALESSSWRHLFSPFFRKGVLIGISLVVLQQWCGINAIIYFAPKIFQEAGFESVKGAIAATLGLGCINFCATILALFLIDRLGRRTLLLLSQGGVALSLLFFTATFIFPSHFFVAVLCLLLFIVSYSIGLGPIPWVLVSEIYPLSIRAHGIALMTFLSWLCNFLVVFTFPRFLASWTGSGAFGLYTLIAIGAFFLFQWIIPETKGKSLEEIETSLYR
jgi:SP family galactose:H+ symporter-like MFS transporter